MIRLGSLENKQGRCHSDTASSLRQPLNSWWPRSSPPPSQFTIKRSVSPQGILDRSFDVPSLRYRV